MSHSSSDFKVTPRALLSFASLLALSCAASAQSQPAQTGKAVQLEDVNVVANNAPTPNAETGSSITVITAEKLERLQQRTVVDALQLAPGLNVVQAGGPGGTAAVFMRGTNSNHVKVFVDGIEQSDPSSATGAVDLSKLLTNDIERIEILRGPQGGLYGSDAIGGVIAITTKRGEGKPKFTGAVETGSFGTLNMKAGVSGAHEGLDYAFNVARTGANVLKVAPYDLLTPDQALQGFQLPHNTSETLAGSGKIGLQLGDSLRLNAFGRYTDSKLRFAEYDFGTFPAQVSPIRAFTNDRQYFGRLEAVWTAFDGRLINTFGVSHGHMRGWTKGPDSMIGLTFPAPWNNYGYVPPNLYIGERTKFDWRGEFAITPDHKIIAGLERETTRLAIPALDWMTQTPVKAKTGYSAGYLEYLGRFGEYATLAANLRRDDHDAFGGHVSWRVAPTLRLPWTDTLIKASYGTGFKAPTLNQLYVSYPAFNYFANPNLRPETSRGFDIGFEQPLFDNRFRFGATYFQNRLKNLIQTVLLDPATFRSSLENIASAKIYGVEAFAALNLSSDFSVRADYTYTSAHDASPVTVANLGGELQRMMREGSGQAELLRRPRHKTTLQAMWKPIDKLTLSASVTRLSSWVDGNRTFSIPRLKAPGYTLVNLAAEYEIAEGVKATGRIENLFNKGYQNPVGYNGLGLSAFAGLKMTY